MPHDYLAPALFLVIGCVFVIATMLLSWALRPSHRTREKLLSYECGEVPVRGAWVRFRIGYYIFALLFVIFDVETAFLYPWAVILRKLSEADRHLSTFAFFEMLGFAAFLGIGLLYAWRKGALKWE
jgi:NADH:ubiquinone oxidoreductase subunit 3 (subunit A)